MKKQYSKKWLSSKNRRKQRKARANAPLHIRRKMMASPLSKELKAEKKRNAIPARTGDEVKILRGKNRKQTGTVAAADLKKRKLYIKGIIVKRRDGNEVMKPIEPSNVMIIKLKEDQKRLTEKRV